MGFGAASDGACAVDTRCGVDAPHGSGISAAQPCRVCAGARSCCYRSAYSAKQVDRLLSNPGFELDLLFSLWVPYFVSVLLTSHGRSTPLLWRTIRKFDLKNRRKLVEDQLLQRLRELIPESVRIAIVADRGFADQKLYAYLRDLNMDYIIRFRQDFLVTDGNGNYESTYIGWRAATCRRSAHGSCNRSERTNCSEA